MSIGEGVIGVDEAGRGCWAGPVVAASVFTPDDAIRKELQTAGVGDSKKLSIAARERLYRLITTHSKVKWAVGVEDAATIDEINIRQATLKAMTSSADDVLFLANQNNPNQCDEKTGPGLAPRSTTVKSIRIDGKDVPSELKNRAQDVRAIVGGDGSDVSIGAASIVAKVFRDRIMTAIHAHYPQYGFDQNKAYGVVSHVNALKTHGPSPIHRFSYKPIRNLPSH